MEGKVQGLQEEIQANKRIQIIRSLAEQYNKEEYFEGDPIIFPKHFARLMQGKEGLPGMGGCPNGERVPVVRRQGACREKNIHCRMWRLLRLLRHIWPGDGGI